jgi:phage minor structural protein
MKKTNILVFDGKTESLVAMLSNKDNKQCPFYETDVLEQLNKDFTFEFSVPADHEDSRHLVRGNLVGFFDLDGNLQVFQIFKTEEEHNGDELSKRIFSEHLFYEMLDDIVENLRVENEEASAALIDALSSSRWENGVVDSLGLKTMSFYYSNGLANIQKVANEYGGELGFRLILDGNSISQRLVDFKTRRGADTGKRFEFNKDMVSVKRTEQLDGLKTALYGRGKGEETEEGGFTRKATFKDVLWRVVDGDPIDKPVGQEWVGDPTALTKFGRENGSRHRFGVFDFDTTDPVELLEMTWQELQRVSTPLVTYEMTVMTLEELTGYEHEKVRLGDTVYVIDRDLGLTIEARVVEIKRDLVNPENTEIILGNFIDDITDYNKKIEEIEATITDRKGVWDKVEDIDVEVDDSTIVNVAPSVPTNVSAQGLFKSIILKWTFDPSIAIAAYEVYGSRVNNFTPDASNLLFRGKSGGFVHDGATNETWYFRLRAVNPHGVTSAFTQQFSASTIALSQPDFVNLTVTNAMIENVSADKITFGVLDGNLAEIVNINADNINAGKIKGQYIEIGSSTTYEDGYDPSSKATPSDVAQAEQNAKDYVDGELVNYVDSVTYGQDLSEIQNQIDGNITSWFYNGVPTLTNEPASSWTTNEDKNKHLGDLYYDNDTGYAYRFQSDGSTTYSWVQLQDNDIQTALQQAADAQDTADQKRRVFVTTPTTPYDVGDLWTQGGSGDLMKCKTARASGSYYASDWEKATKYTDDSRAISAETNAKAYADTKKQEAIDSANDYAKQKAEAERVLAEAYADGVVDDEEQARINDVNAKLQTAKTYADEKKAEAIQAAEGLADQAEANAKDYSKPTMKEFYDKGFEHGTDFWSDSYVGENLAPTTKGTVAPSLEALEGGNLWTIQGSHWLYSKNAIPVNVNRTYQVTFRVRQTVNPTTAGASKVYAGVVTLDENLQNLTGGAGTHRYCATSGTEITVENDWQTFTGLIRGVGDLHDNFREGTRYVRPMIIVNYSGGDGTVEVDYVDFKDVTEIVEIESRVADVELKTTNESIIATVTSSTQFETELGKKADSQYLTENYPDNEALDQAKKDINDATDGKITALGVPAIATRVSNVEQRAEQIDFKFTNSGGVNLLRNSVGYADDDFWFPQSGAIDTLQNNELSQIGAGSGWWSKLGESGKYSQKVSVVNSNRYTLSFYMNKSQGTGTSDYAGIDVFAGGTKLSFVGKTGGVTNGFEKFEYNIDTDLAEIEIVITMGAGAEAIITNLMVNIGDVPLQWTLASGEVYNTNVLMDMNGVRVISNQYEGYTAITPQEFSGYAEVYNPITEETEMKRVFTLNKDTTEVANLKAENEVRMTPLKMIPVREGNFNGWAFVPED